MVAYEDYVKLCASTDSEDRGLAAHYAAFAFISHDGPPDEQAALYAALINFLDDSSVKVRAALAYGLLHSDRAPRPVILSLLYDSAIIARAVAQYSPVLLDADLISLVQNAETGVLVAVAARQRLGSMVARALISCDVEEVTLMVLRRADIVLNPAVLEELVTSRGHVAAIRGALLERLDLSANMRMQLVDQVRAALLGSRIVKGAIQPRRLDRLMRDASDKALTSIGERDVAQGRNDFVFAMVRSGRISMRTMVHALVCGRVAFFASCVAQLSGSPRDKIVGLLDRGSRGALTALLGRCGFGPAQARLVMRLVILARAADLINDLAARYYVVTVVVEELIVEYEGAIPDSLTDLFGYLNEQNIALARKAARGVLETFVAEEGAARPMLEQPRHKALPAA